MDDEIRDPQTYAILGAAMEVHRQLGPGFLEPVYQEAMAIELTLRSIPFIPQLELPVFYKGQRLKSFYKPDFFVTKPSLLNSRRCRPSLEPTKLKR
jgi:GxxExxY protein